MRRRSSLRRSLSWWLLVAAPTIAACGAPEPRPRPPEMAARRPTPEVVVRRLLERTPAQMRWLGFHDFDGRVADYSEAGLRARITELRQARVDLADLGQGLTVDGELDAQLARQKVELDLFELTELETWRTHPNFYAELFSVDDYIVRDYAPLEDRAAAMLRHLRAAAAQIPNIRKNLRSPLSEPVVKTSIGIYRGYAEYLRGDVQTFLDGVKDQETRTQAKAAANAVAMGAEAVAQHLEKVELPKADQSHVLGRARYERLLLAQEALDTPIEVLVAMAEEDLAKNRAAYEKLASEVSKKRPAASQLLAEARAVVESSKKFVLEKKIVTLPAKDAVRVEETPPFMRWNSAFLNGPGPFDSPELVAYYYVTLPDPSWPAKEQEEYVMPHGELVATSVHEVFPGHYVQGLWQRNAPTFVQKVSSSYSFSEGWAHYVEQMMVDEGFGAEDPETRLGQLGDALLRNCRFVASIGLHVNGWTVEQAKQRFVEDCKQDEANARQQAVRGTFDPGYFAYTLGKLQILALREEAKAKLGPRFDLQRFHDVLLSHGAPPVPLVRARVLEELGAK